MTELERRVAELERLVGTLRGQAGGGVGVLRQLTDGAAATLLHSHAVGVAVYNSSIISLPDAVWTALTFDSERRDDADFHSTVSNTSRLTVPTGYAGWYVISGHAQFAGNATGSYREIALRLNGAPYIALAGTHPRGTVEIYESIAAVYYLSDGDYVEFLLLQNSGVSLSIAAGPNHSPEFRMVRLG